MHVIWFNISWMSYNLFLAVIPVIAALLLLKSNNVFFKIFLGVIWLILLPNSIYLITDIIHLPEDLQKNPTTFIQFLLILQYVLLFALGIATYIFALHPFERLLKRKKIQPHFWLYIINFLVGFGIVLGRINRLNSWDIITQYQKVFMSSADIFTTPLLFLYAIIFGIVANIFYFSCKKFIIKEVKELEKM